MCVPGAIAATSAAMVIRKPAEAARDPDGPDEHGDRRLRRDDRGVDVAGGVDEAAGRAQREDDQRRAGRVGLTRSLRAGIPPTTGWMMPSTSAR